MAPPMGQTGAGSGSDYRRPSRFADAPPPAREVPDKRPGGGFSGGPSPRPPGHSDNQGGSFYGRTANSPPALHEAQSVLGDFRGPPDKMQAPSYPGSQPPRGGEEMETQHLTPPFSQPPPGAGPYARPPPANPPPGGFGGPHWASTMGAPNGRQDWRPGFGGSDYYNPMQQQRLPGNWQQPDGMQFSRFH